jgi:hypothetical protein
MSVRFPVVASPWMETDLYSELWYIASEGSVKGDEFPIISSVISSASDNLRTMSRPLVVVETHLGSRQAPLGHLIG